MVCSRWDISRWISYVYPTSLAIRSGAAARSRERINNDTINLAHFPLPSRFARRRPLPLEEIREGTEGGHEAIKNGFTSRGLVTTAFRTFIIFLPDPRKRPAKSRRYPCRTPWPHSFSLPLSFSSPLANQSGKLS